MTEAVVYRTVKRQGKLVNEELFRFGYEPGDTWYIQRLIPDSAITNKLVVRDANIVGASKNAYWVLSAENMHVADKAHASGSVPEAFGAPYRGLLFGTMTLQFPCPVEWHGLEFATAQGTVGQITLDNGRLVEARWKVKQSRGTNDGWEENVTKYDYAGSSNGLPRAFTIADSHMAIESRFVSVVLGSNPRLGTNGYIPAMFSHALKETVEFWTNNQSYVLASGRLQSTKLPPGTRVYGGKHPVWPLVLLISIGLIIAPCLIFLALRNKRLATQQKETK